MTNLPKEWGNSTTELDFEEHWSPINVQREVLRGVELREQKPKINEKDYDFVDIALPSCSKSPGTTSPRRYRARKVPRKTRLKQISKNRHCPLRVVELAEPTKRHCLNTWKNNYRTLPDYMVERLRRHVMDEEPVVKISEAVNYFKNRKTSRKRSTNNFKKRPKKKQDFNMILSSLFAYRITQQLNIPVNILLSQELQNINHIVTDEINSILRKKKSSRNIYKNDEILNEMAKKVTIWITNILEETSYKQLLEQLQEMEEEEGPALDILDELLERITCKTSDHSDSMLSEESDSIYASLSTKKTEDGTESAFGDISEETTNFKVSDYAVHLDEHKILSENDENIYYANEIVKMNEKLEMTEQVKSLLEERINYVVDNIGNINNNNNTINTDETIVNPLFNDLKIDNNSSDLNQTTDNNNNMVSSTDHYDIVTEGTIMTDLNNTNDFTFNRPGSDMNLESPTDDIYEQNDIKLHSDAAVVDEMNKLSIEDLDEETKKVKFSNINLGNGESWPQINKYSSEFDYKKPVVLKSSKDYILSHFNVAPPNPNLLSYIDEVWPEYILPPLLKATESVNKSVTSLGRIIEADDENIIQSPTQRFSKENIETVFNQQLNTAIINSTDEGGSKKIRNKDIVKPGNYINNDKEFVRDWQRDDQPSLEQHELFIHFSTDEDVNVKIHKKEDLKKLENNKQITKHRQENRDPQSSLEKKSMNDVEIPEILPSHDKVHIWKEQTIQECGDVKSIKSNITMQLELKHRSAKESIKNTLTGSPKTHVNNTYITVNKKVQTSFVINPNKDEFCTERDMKNIRKWCMGLQNVTENLELWTAWIQNVCSNLTYLKHEGMSSGTSKNQHIKKWIKLKDNIDVDVQLWSQLQTRLGRGLRTYNNSYHMTRQATSIQANMNKCNCNNSSQKKSLCSKIVFENYYSNTRRL